MKIFCLPYAGGSAVSIYSKYKKYKWSNHINIVPVELAGKGIRIDENMNNNIFEVVEDITSFIKKSIINTSEKYCIWGHSMGGLLAFEVIRELKKTSMNQPENLIISGSLPPFEKNKDVGKYKLPEKKFIDYLITSHGIEKSLADDSIFIKVFLPIIKNDFKLLDGYVYKRGEAQNISSFILYSEEDNEDNVIFKWGEVLENVVYKRISGNHYFINDCYDEVANYLDTEFKKKFCKKGKIYE